MKNIFKSLLSPKPNKTEVVIDEVSVDDVSAIKKYSSDIEQIHHEFEIASDVLVEQAKIHIEEANKKPVDKVKRLTSLGFTQANQVSETHQAIKQAEFSKEQIEWVQYYKRKYPLNKFITEEQVKTICYKYGLVLGEVGRFRGFVPEKNLTEIERFKCDKKDCRQKALSIGIALKYIGDVVDDDGANAALYKSLYKLEKRDMPIQICAPLKDMDMTGMTIEDGYKMKRIHIPDPVVLQPVNGGFLILTAWGDEASDPIVVNETMN